MREVKFNEKDLVNPYKTFEKKDSGSILKEGQLNEAKIRQMKEAAFRAGKAAGMIEKVARILSRRVNVNIAVSTVPEQFMDEDGNFEGFFGFIGSSRGIRFNFLKGHSDVFDSVDIYENSTEIQPTYRVDLNGYNIVQVIDQIADVITGEYERYDESRSTSRFLLGKTKLDEKTKLKDMVTAWLEANTGYLREIGDGTFDYKGHVGEFLDFIRDEFDSKKSDMSPGALQKNVRRSLEDNDDFGVNPQNVASVSVKSGPDPEPVLDPDIQAVWDRVQNIPPKRVMELLENDTRLIAKGDPMIPGLLVYGKPGTGKTQTVEEVLEEEGVKPVVIDDKLTSYTKFVTTMYEYKQDEIILIDDNDSIFDTEENVNLLKKLLDMKPVRKVRVSQKVKVPGDDSTVIEKGEEFEFTSKLIFVSNKTTMDTAIQSRLSGVMHEINFSKDEMLEIIKENLNNLYADVPSITDAMREEVYDFVERSMPVVNEIDYRAFNYCLQYRDSAEKQDGDPDWQGRSMSLLMNYMKKHAKKKF